MIALSGPHRGCILRFNSFLVELKAEGYAENPLSIQALINTKVLSSEIKYELENGDKAVVLVRTFISVLGTNSEEGLSTLTTVPVRLCSLGQQNLLAVPW